MSRKQLEKYYDDFTGDKSAADLSELSHEQQGWWNTWVGFDKGSDTTKRNMNPNDLTPKQRVIQYNTNNPEAELFGRQLFGQHNTAESRGDNTTLNIIMNKPSRTWSGFFKGKGKRKSRRSRVHSRTHSRTHSRSKKSTRRRRKA